MLLNRSRSHLVLIDLQERLAAPIAGTPATLENIIRLVGFARRLGVPISVTEQAPSMNGSTVPVLQEAVGGAATVLPKRTFSAWRDEAAMRHFRALRQLGRDQIVLAGHEAHVAVCQTALDLIGADFDVFVVADAIGARDAFDRETALARMGRAGAAMVVQEMVAMEWLERSDTPEFNDLRPLMKTS